MAKMKLSKFVELLQKRAIATPDAEFDVISLKGPTVLVICEYELTKFHIEWNNPNTIGPINGDWRKRKGAF